MIKLQSFLDKLNMPEDQQDSFLAEYTSFRDIIKDKDGVWTMSPGIGQSRYSVDEMASQLESKEERFDSYRDSLKANNKDYADWVEQFERDFPDEGLTQDSKSDKLKNLLYALRDPKQSKSSPSSWKKHLKHDNQDLNGDDEDLLEYLKDRLGVANDYVNRDKSNPTIADGLKLDQMAFKQLNMALQSMLIQYLKRADQQDKINLVTDPCEMYVRYKFKIVIEEK